MTRLRRRTGTVTSWRGTMIHLPGLVAFRLRVLARTPIDRSKLRTPSIGEGSSRFRIAEGTRSATHIRAMAATNTNPRRAPLCYGRAERDVRERFRHRESNTPNSCFKHPGKLRAGRKRLRFT